MKLNLLIIIGLIISTTLKSQSGFNYDTVPKVLLISDTSTDINPMAYYIKGYVVTRRAYEPSGVYPSGHFDEKFYCYLGINRKRLPKNLLVWNYR